ncbi:hypothetical protein EYF80_042470 [Liparis tanakae]|uniref:Uncharacterized protein n=1 Tax=Liparis tanakae TaxID=230148 RepID=A0A4Z2G3B8_9TELE|nr:hypothetical protein EYF80_042470 [Liparis tanakae]
MSNLPRCSSERAARASSFALLSTSRAAVASWQPSTSVARASSLALLSASKDASAFSRSIVWYSRAARSFCISEKISENSLLISSLSRASMRRLSARSFFSWSCSCFNSTKCL